MLHTTRAHVFNIRKMNLLGLVFTCFLFPADADAKRVALIIGNANYQYETRLNNPTNDANLIGQVLRSDLKFDEVEVLENLNIQNLNRALARFKQQSKTAEVAVIYFSGHGQQDENGKNYLIAVDAKIEHPADLGVYAMSSDQLVQATEGAQVRLVILDACRDRNSSLFKSGSKGLSRVERLDSDNLLIAYATQEGKVAQDGIAGGYSPYAAALASNMKKNVPILEMLDAVTDQVEEQTQRRQRPTRSGNMRVSTYLQRISAIPSKDSSPQPASNSEQTNPASITAQNALKDCMHCPELVPVSLIYPNGESYQVNVGKYEVTKQQFAVFVQETNYRITHEGCYVLQRNFWRRDSSFSFLNPSFIQTDNHPVTCINYEDTQKYLEWLRQKTGKNYRLPSLYEWEQLASTPQKTQFNTGDCLTSTQANYDGRNVLPHCVDHRKTFLQATQVVGSYVPSLMGLYDLHGNVSEWTDTCEQNGSPSQRLTLQACRGRKFYLKGGAWIDPVGKLAVSALETSAADIRRYSYGFRVVRAND